MEIYTNFLAMNLVIAFDFRVENRRKQNSSISISLEGRK